MLDLAKLDLDEIAMALSDQTDYEHRWLIDPGTGEIVLWTSDTGIDGENPVDLDELDLLPLGPRLDLADLPRRPRQASCGRMAARGRTYPA